MPSHNKTISSKKANLGAGKFAFLTKKNLLFPTHPQLRKTPRPLMKENLDFLFEGKILGAGKILPI
jgi:hypothetical protein